MNIVRLRYIEHSNEHCASNVHFCTQTHIVYLLHSNEDWASVTIHFALKWTLCFYYSSCTLMNCVNLLYICILTHIVYLAYILNSNELWASTVHFTLNRTLCMYLKCFTQLTIAHNYTVHFALKRTMCIHCTFVHPAERFISVNRYEVCIYAQPRTRLLCKGIFDLMWNVLFVCKCENFNCDYLC